MSDRHLRLLRAVAKRRQTDAERHQTEAGHDEIVASAGSTARGRELRLVAARTTARLRAAEARRNSSSDA
jgi:hypothetical protein